MSATRVERYALIDEGGRRLVFISREDARRIRRARDGEEVTVATLPIPPPDVTTPLLADLWRAFDRAVE